MEDNNQQHDGEIIGLHSPENGRSCVMHDCCGWHVVRFKKEMQEVVYHIPVEILNLMLGLSLLSRLFLSLMAQNNALLDSSLGMWLQDLVRKRI